MTTKRKQKAAAPAAAPPVTIDNIVERTLHRALELVTNPELYEAEMNPEGGNPIALGPRVPDAADWAKDQIDAAKSKAAKWLANSKKPKKVPSEAALAAKAKYENRLKEALDEDRWGGAMKEVDEEVRMKVIENVGSAGFSKGVEDHKPKVEAKVKKLQPLVLALAKELDDMPVGTDEEREAKMIAAKRGMQGIGKVMKGG